MRATVEPRKPGRCGASVYLVFLPTVTVICEREEPVTARTAQGKERTIACFPGRTAVVLPHGGVPSWYPSVKLRNADRAFAHRVLRPLQQNLIRVPDELDIPTAVLLQLPAEFGVNAGPSPIAEVTRWAILSAQPSLTPAGFQLFVGGEPGTTTARIKAGVEHCERGKPLPVDWMPVHVTDVPLSPGVSRIYELLADNVEEENTRGCLLALSAASCVRDIQDHVACSSTSALGKYARTVFSSSSTAPGKTLLEPEEFVGALFQAKEQAYRAGTPDAKLTLVQMHLALAHVYRERNRPDGIGHDTRWHLQRAKYFWTTVGSGRPFPAAIEAQLLKASAHP